jgi:hypothetical protein
VKQLRALLVFFVGRSGPLVSYRGPSGRVPPMLPPAASIGSAARGGLSVSGPLNLGSSGSLAFAFQGN